MNSYEYIKISPYLTVWVYYTILFCTIFLVGIWVISLVNKHRRLSEIFIVTICVLLFGSYIFMYNMAKETIVSEQYPNTYSAKNGDYLYSEQYGAYTYREQIDTLLKEEKIVLLEKKAKLNEIKKIEIDKRVPKKSVFYTEETGTNGVNILTYYTDTSDLIMTDIPLDNGLVFNPYYFAKILIDDSEDSYVSYSYSEELNIITDIVYHINSDVQIVEKNK